MKFVAYSKIYTELEIGSRGYTSNGVYTSSEHSLQNQVVKASAEKRQLLCKQRQLTHEVKK